MVQNIWKYSVPPTNDSIHQWTNSQWPHLIKDPFTNDPIRSMNQFNQRLPFNNDSFTNDLHSLMTHFWMTHSANDHIQSMTPLSSMTHSPMKLFTNTPFLNDPFTNVPILNDPFEWMAPIHQWSIQSITPLPSVNDPIQQWLIQNGPIQVVFWCRSFCQFLASIKTKQLMLCFEMQWRHSFHSVYFGRPGLIQTADDRWQVSHQQ